MILRGKFEINVGENIGSHSRLHKFNIQILCSNGKDCTFTLFIFLLLVSI